MFAKATRRSSENSAKAARWKEGGTVRAEKANLLNGNDLIEDNK